MPKEYIKIDRIRECQGHKFATIVVMMMTIAKLEFSNSLNASNKEYYSSTTPTMSVAFQENMNLRKRIQWNPSHAAKIEQYRGKISIKFKLFDPLYKKNKKKELEIVLYIICYQN